MTLTTRLKHAFTRKGAWIFPIFLVSAFVPPFNSVTPAKATFSTNTQISGSQAFLQGEFAEVGVRANGAFGSTSVPSGFHQNITNCLGFRVDREMDGWANAASTDDGDFFCPGSPFEGWQMKVGSNLAKNDNGQTGISGSVSDIQTAGSSQCVTWASNSAYNGVSVSQRYCVPTAGQALHTDVTITNISGSAITDVYFGRGFDPDNTTGTDAMTCNGATVNTNVFGSCNAVTGQGTEAQATARWGNGAFIALQSFDSRARVARQAGGFSSPDPSSIWTAGDTSATSGTYYGNVAEIYADAGIYVALKVPTLGAGASTSFRISYVLSADGNNAPVIGAPIASGIGQTSVHVAATLNPKGYSTTAELVYSTSSSFATSSSVSMGTFTGSDELTAEADITGLSPSTTYYAKVVAENETGTTESSVFDFETLAATAPTVESDDPTVSVDDGPVTLHGSFNPNGFSSTAYFEYGTTADFSGTVISVPVSGTFTGTDPYDISTTLSDLTSSTTYYFRVKVTNASGTAYGSTISFVPADVPAPTSLIITSLDDTTSSGTLRWAITQANGTSGGMYDSITFGVSGEIVLSSALPQITESVTITGNGRTNTVIDGDNAFRLFYVQSGRTLTISNMTLKQGASVNGGLIYNGQGTVSATNIRFTGMSGGTAVWNNNGGSTATYTNCTFDFLSVGIGADYGSTPQLPDGTTSWIGQGDSAFGNRTYVYNCIFANNYAGIDSQRFTYVEDSIFNDNSYGASIQGLNRSQIFDSTFESNGIGIYHNSWIPTTFNMGTNNRLINGNTFTNNGVSVYLDDGYNNGHKYQGWATVTNNTWDEVGTWITYYLWDSSNNAVGSLSADDTTELFVHSGNTSSVPATTTTTTTTVPATITTTTTTTTTEPAPVVVPTPTTTSTELPVITEPETTTTLEPTTTTEVTIPTETTVVDTTTTTEVELPTTTTTEPPTTTTTVVEEEITTIIDSIDSATTEEAVAILEEVIASDISVEELTSVLEAVFDEPLTDEEFTAVIDAVISEDITPEELAAVLEVLDSDTVSEEQVAEVVDKLIENGVTEDQATQLATNSKVLESIDTTQAQAIFEAVPVGDLTQEEEAALVAAVTNAPQEVKETFEATIDIFGEGLDDYVPVGSQVDVGSRRTLIAASTAVASIAGAAATGGPSGGSREPSGGSSGGSGGGVEGRSKREEEAGEEPAGEIAGPEEEDDEELTRNSIFNYYLEEGIWKKKISWLGLIRKFVNETAALAFTLAGSVVVFITLSGETRKTAMIATGVALAVHYVHVLLKNDEA